MKSYGWVLIAFLALGVRARADEPLGTAFSYQGVLTTTGGAPITGTDAADLRFRLYDVSSGGPPVAGPYTVSGVDFDSKGLFNVLVDFGGVELARSARWLEIDVSAPPGSPFITLVPRQRLIPAPVAQAAGSVVVDTIYGPSPPIHVTNRGSSGAALFGIDNVGSNADAVGAQTNGSGAAVRGSATGVSGLNYGVYGSSASSSGYAGFFDGRGYFSDNVGVGTPSPQAALHVMGEVRSEGATGGTVGTRNPGNASAFANFSWFGSVARIRVGGSGAGSTNGFDIQGLGDVSLLRILGNGFVGIGTTAPSQPLTVASDSTAAAANAVLAMLTSTNTGSQSAAVFGINSGTVGDCLEGQGVTRYGVWGSISSCQGAGVFGQSMHTASGYGVQGIGFTGIYGTSSAANGFAAYFDNGRVYVNEKLGVGVGAPTFKLELPNVASDVGGRGRANAWVTYSSGRWKHNVATLDDALGKLMQLRGVSFEWNAEHGGSRDIGFVAEEVGRVFPEIVSWEPGGQAALGLAYDRLVAVTVEAIKQEHAQIQAQQRQIDEQAAELAALRAELSDVRRRLSELARLPAAPPHSGNETAPH